MPESEIAVSGPDLTHDERSLLWNGLSQWGGPARMSDALARAIGFESAQEFGQWRLLTASSIMDGDVISGKDWARILVSTEIVFASDVFGAGVEWPMVTGLADIESIELLRSVQRKLVAFRSRLS